MKTKIANILFFAWAAVVTYHMSASYFLPNKANAAFVLNSASRTCTSLYEKQSTGGIQSGGWYVYTNLHQWFYTARPNADSSLWGYSTCNAGDVVVGVRPQPFDLGAGAGSLGIDVLCCKLSN